MWPSHRSAVTPSTSCAIQPSVPGGFSFVGRDDCSISPQDFVCALRVATPGYDTSQTEVAVLLQGCHWSSTQQGVGCREEPQGLLLKKGGRN